MWCDARWLKLPQEEIKNKKIYHGDMTGRFAYFRCEVELPEKQGSRQILRQVPDIVYG